MLIDIVRDYFISSTNGSLYINGEYICKTIELPWRGNAKNVSCIPEGVYPVKRIDHYKHGKCFIVEDVRNRSGILIHPANVAVTELRGCIAPVSVLTGEGVGSNSKAALKRLQLVLGEYGDSPVEIQMEIMNRNDFKPYEI